MNDPDIVKSLPLAEPPEGVLAGENVPVENESDDLNENEIQEIIGMLKIRGEPYTEMKRYELREKAIDIINDTGGFID